MSTIKRAYNGKVYQSHYLRRTYRKGTKILHETLGNISHLPDRLIDIIRRSLKGEPFFAASEDFAITRSLPHGHVAAVHGMLRKLGVETLLGAKRTPCRDIIEALIVMRVIHPGSKLSTTRNLRTETAASTLGQTLDLEEVTEDDLYLAMDWLLTRQTSVERKLAERHLDEGSLVLYDVSSSYYTGTHCSLAKHGHPHDGNRKFPQIVYGLLCNREGCPVAIEVFEGNTSDTKTLKNQIKKVRKRFGLKRVILIGDRGMITDARIKEEITTIEGLDWITALRAPSILKLVRQKEIDISLFDERNLAEITSPDYPGERLIVCRNPLLAHERARKREELLRATQKDLDRVVKATKRARKPLRGKDAIGIAVGKVINEHKMGKHFIAKITEESFEYRRNEERITEEASLDGMYVIRTSVPAKELGPEETVKAYKGLAVCERAFRSLKTVDLKIRPIFHYLENRVRAHVFLCMLAYYVEWHMRRDLAPILFDDEDKEIAEQLRASVIDPAERSPRASKKDETKRTEEGEPVHSFRTLLNDLGTLVRNQVRITAGDENDEFPMLTEPTPVQRRAFELLGLTVAL